MAPEETAADRRERFFRPALLIELIEPILLGEQVLRDLAPDDPDRLEVIWRLAELRVRIDPITVLRTVDTLPAPSDADRRERVRCEALLACGHVDEASLLIEAGISHRTGVWRVLRGMRDVARGDVEQGIAGFEAALEADDIDAEWRALTLSYVIDALGRGKNREAIEKHTRELLVLLTKHEASLSIPLVQLTAGINASGHRDGIMTKYWQEKEREAREALVEGTNLDQASIGPVPLHVHVAFHKFRDPTRIEQVLFQIGGLQFRSSYHNEAYATFFYAAGIAKRVMPPALATRFQEGYEAFRDIIGPAAIAAAEDYIQQRVDTFRRTMRAKD